MWASSSIDCGIFTKLGTNDEHPKRNISRPSWVTQVIYIHVSKDFRLSWNCRGHIWRVFDPGSSSSRFCFFSSFL